MSQTGYQKIGASEERTSNIRLRTVLIIAGVIVLVGTAVTVALCLTLIKPAPRPRNGVPVVINTWGFVNATRAAFKALQNTNTEFPALDAIEFGCNQCEDEPMFCGWSVGYGGSPSEFGETTLDSMIMWAPNFSVGAVGSLKRIKNAISVARKVMERTYQTLLVGDDATDFALRVGFQQTNLSTPESIQMWQAWKNNGSCCPSYWKGVDPPPVNSTLTAKEITKKEMAAINDHISATNHDTIGMIAIDVNGNIACGTSTNGLTFRVQGRVGDSPIMGAGAYCDQEGGGAAATGLGDVMMRFLPSLRAVEYMKFGYSPTDACQLALAPIEKYYPGTKGALVCINIYGEVGAANINWSPFPYSMQNSSMSEPQIFFVQ